MSFMFRIIPENLADLSIEILTSRLLREEVPV
jgi:hypothetical protein